VKAVVSCAVTGCWKQARSRGWCSMHYQRNRRHGDPVDGYATHVMCCFCGNLIHKGNRRLAVTETDSGKRLGTLHPRCWTVVQNVITQRKVSA